MRAADDPTSVGDERLPSKASYLLETGQRFSNGQANQACGYQRRPTSYSKTVVGSNFDLSFNVICDVSLKGFIQNQQLSECINE
jgi:hypothetical protein